MSCLKLIGAWLIMLACFYLPYWFGIAHRYEHNKLFSMFFLIDRYSYNIVSLVYLVRMLKGFNAIDIEFGT